MEKSSEEGKWLSKFYGLSFLPPEDVENSFIEDIMNDAPNDDKCLQFADCTSCIHYRFINLSIYNVGSSSRLDQQTHEQRPESFHSKLNAHLYASHPNIFLFVDVKKKIQATIKSRAIDSIFAPRRCEMENLQFPVAQFECYSKGEKTGSDFIKCIGYKIGAVI
jgi:hypothetical protein